LKIKRLSDVCKALKINYFSATEKPPKSYRKATEKTTEKHQTVENQGLDEFLFSFSVLPKRPTHQARRPAPPDHLTFVKSDPRFFYTFL
jgi:hypothetical protein